MIQAKPGLLSAVLWVGGLAGPAIAPGQPLRLETDDSDANVWKGLYAESSSCSNSAEGQCVFVTTELFEGALTNPQTIAVASGSRLTVSSARNSSSKTLSFTRITEDLKPAPGTRLVRIKVPLIKGNRIPVFSRLMNTATGPVLFLEPLPWG